MSLSIENIYSLWRDDKFSLWLIRMATKDTADDIGGACWI